MQEAAGGDGIQITVCGYFGFRGDEAKGRHRERLGAIRVAAKCPARKVQPTWLQSVSSKEERSQSNREWPRHGSPGQPIFEDLPLFCGRGGANEGVSEPSLSSTHGVNGDKPCPRD